MKWVVIAMLIFFCCSAFGQRNSYNVRPGEDLNKMLADSVRFLYPAFTRGTVFFRDETNSSGALNFNIINNEMQFIAPGDDTLALTNEATIKYIAIGADTFFYDNVYLRLVESNGTAKLAKKEEIQTGDVRKEGGYGVLSSTSSITTYSSLISNGQAADLTLKQEITISKITTYYLGDLYNHFLQASKKNVMKLFGKKQNALEQYFKNNKVSFNKEEDLKALAAFLNQ